MAAEQNGPLLNRSLDSLLLSVRDLTVAFRVNGAWTPVVRGVDLDVRTGEMVGLVGESGSGKTVTALSIPRLLPVGARILTGRIELEGEDLVRASDARLREIRGPRVSVAFQEPATALNPVLTVGYQLEESLAPRILARRNRSDRARELLDLVGIPGATQKMRDYPHRLSGGQRQRVMIAMALAADPDLLIVDEPTSALDVTVQAQILELLDDLRTRLHLSVLLITHDLSVVAMCCDRALVMYAGQIVEEAAVERLYASPAHPYSRGLISSRLGAEGTAPRTARCPTLAGRVPDPGALPTGCAFHPRCEEEFPACRVTEPRLIAVQVGQKARCLVYEESSDGVPNPS